jgi:hypothetical protein
VSQDGIVSSLKYLFADFLEETDTTPPFLPDGLPDQVAAAVSEAIHLLMEYQGASYAKLYVDRIGRFVDKGLADDTFAEMARQMASRMAYLDAIRIAQLKLAEYRDSDGEVVSTDIKRFRLDELVDALPAVAADPILKVLDKFGWARRRVSIPFSTASRWSIRRLKMEAWLRRWRLFSIRYGRERLWVERWLHMVARSLVKRAIAQIRARATSPSTDAAAG